MSAFLDGARASCPRDGAALVRESPARGVALRRCPRCKSLWFGHGELARYAVARGREPRLDPRDGRLAAVSDEPPLACPDCRTSTLAAHRYQQRALHQCASCAGLLVPPELEAWLDRPRPPLAPVTGPHDGFPTGRTWIGRLIWGACRVVVEFLASLVGK